MNVHVLAVAGGDDPCRTDDSAPAVVNVVVAVLETTLPRP